MTRSPSHGTSADVDLLRRAQSGDKAATSDLLKRHEANARRLLRLLVVQPDDVDDLSQDTLLDAFTRLGDGAEEPFSRWIEDLAVGKATTFLADQTAFRPAAQIIAQAATAEAGLIPDVAAILADGDFAFEVARHVAFCFSVVARSLPLAQQVAVVLVDVVGYPLEHASRVLKVDDEALLRFLNAGRAELVKLFEGLCGLANENAPCQHCHGLRDASPEGRKGADLAALSLDAATPDERMFRRLRVVRDASPELDRGATHRLHDFLGRLVTRVETERERNETDRQLPAGKHRWEDLQDRNN